MLVSSQAEGRDLRGPYRLGQEPDDHGASPSCSARPARRSPCCATRCPTAISTKQAVQRFERYEDLEAADATIEEREEYEPHLAEGNLVFAGVDYERDPARGGAGSRRHPLGRRQQRHAVHQARPAHRRRRSASSRTRAPLPPGRDEPPHGGRLHREQDGQRVAGRDRRRARARSARTTRPRESFSPQSPFHVEGDAEEISGQARARRRGRPDADARRDDVRRSCPRREAVRRGRARRPAAIRSRLDREDVRGRTRTSGRCCRRWATDASRWRTCARRSKRADADLVLIGTPIDLRKLIDLDKPALRVTYKLQEIGEPTLKDVLAEKGLLETALV